jgi:PhnB protein
MQLANYLFFTTTCEQALAFYTRCGLGTVTQMMRYGAEGMPVPTPEMQGKIMHARFEGAGVLFYASDNHDAEPMRGSAHLLMIDSRESTDRLFAQLADGGTITTPLGMQPWCSGCSTARYDRNLRRHDACAMTTSGPVAA